MSIRTSVDDLNRLVAQRQLLEGFDRYYASDVVMLGNGEPATIGKGANLEREKVFVGGLTKWDAKLIASNVDDDRGVAMNEWELAFTHEAWGDVNVRQVSVQQWRGGQIVHEAFYKL